MERIPPRPELRGRILDGLPSPVAGVGNYDGESVDIAILILIGDSGERVPFEKRSVGNLEPIERLHGSVLEVQADSVVGENFWVDFSETET